MLVALFRALILYLFYKDYIQPEAASSSIQRSNLVLSVRGEGVWHIITAELNLIKLRQYCINFPGTNGGVSLVGTISSLIGGLIVGVSYYLTLIFSLSDDYLQKCAPQWPIIVLGILSGFLGSTIDSYIGATLQYSGLYFTLSCTVLFEQANCIDWINFVIYGH